MILVIFPTLVEPFLVPLPEVVVYFLMNVLQSLGLSILLQDQNGCHCRLSASRHTIALLPVTIGPLLSLLMEV